MLKAEASNFIKNNTSPWVFFKFFELYKWHQIAQSTAYYFFIQIAGRSLTLCRRFFQEYQHAHNFSSDFLKILNKLVVSY